MTENPEQQLTDSEIEELINHAEKIKNVGDIKFPIKGQLFKTIEKSNEFKKIITVWEATGRIDVDRFKMKAILKKK